MCNENVLNIIEKARKAKIELNSLYWRENISVNTNKLILYTAIVSNLS
jgi:hypothetical protein